MTRWLVLFPLAVIAAHAALLPLGEWQMDEFVILHGLQQHGFAYVAERLANWSPRPLSELILWLYQLGVARLHRPLITSVLASLWLLLLGAALVASRWPRACGAGPGAIRAPAAPGLAIAALLACCLLLGKPGEVFYWPAAAVAYLPTLAAVAFATVAVGLVPEIEVWSLRARAVLCAALVVAASSSEMGAMFVLLNCTGQILRSIIATYRRPQPPARNLGSLVRMVWPWLLPGAVAALLLVTFGHHRAGTQEAIPVEVPTLHDLPASFVAGASKFGQELVGVPEERGGLLLGAVVKLCLFLGFRPRLTGTAHWSRATSLIQSAALLGAGLFSLVFAYWQFGAACCERHETMRQCFIVLALFAAACALPVAASPRSRHGWLRSDSVRAGLLVLPLVVLTALRVPDLGHAYALVHPTIAARDATWRSGLACCTSAMEFHNPPHTSLMTAYALRPGLYAQLPSGTVPGDPSARDASDILVFFGKSSLLAH